MSRPGYSRTLRGADGAILRDPFGVFWVVGWDMGGTPYRGGPYGVLGPLMGQRGSIVGSTIEVNHWDEQAGLQSDA